jgi:hypothetical protein
MQQPPDYFPLHGFLVPVRMSVADVRHEHPASRNPHVESNSDPVLGPLSPEDFSHGIIQRFDLIRVQSVCHFSRPLISNYSLQDFGDRQLNSAFEHRSKPEFLQGIK